MYAKYKTTLTSAYHTRSCVSSSLITAKPDSGSLCNLIRVWERPLWPGNSPDLNPIENLWPILQDSVHQEPRPTNLTELATRVNEVWEGIDSTHLSNLSNSMVKRMELLQMNNYLPIKY